MKKLLFVLVLCAGLVGFSGCDFINQEEESGDVSSSSASQSSSAIDLSTVTWLHTNVSGWEETANLSSVDVTSSTITLNYDKSTSWPKKNHLGADLVANPWIFVKQDGVWYAATFEWFGYGQNSKPTFTVKGDHIKQPPLHNFSPKSGETYGFMVSALARDRARTVEERSNIVMKEWP